MPLTDYEESTLTREEVDTFHGPVVLEFGASWCGICQGFKPQAENAFAPYDHIRHIRVEDGPGKRLGRSFKVKLWPTFVFMLDGKVLQTSVRPTQEEVSQGLAAIGGNMNG
nr:thioredoxin [uncultured bacterium]